MGDTHHAGIDLEVGTLKIGGVAVAATAAQLNNASTGEVGTGAISTAELANDAVTSDKIADNAVTSDQIAADAVTSSEIAAGAVATAELGAAAVTAAKAAVFVSTEQTGTGSSQNVAHGLGATPAAVLVALTELGVALAGGADIAEGAHDGTNVVLTVTNGLKFKVLAWA